MSVSKGVYHARWCPALLDSEKLCKCVAGTKGLARSKEGFSYTGGDSKRATARRRFQIALGRLKVSE